jgi:radical SAM protein with 4Fe4S-binding SPASM domain
MVEKIKIETLSKIFSGLSLKKKFEKYRRLWEQAAKYEVLTDFPLHLDIELAGVCNLRCDFCFQNDLITKPLGLMDMDMYTKIIDEGKRSGLCAIKLQIRGESFLHPRLFDCICYAKDAGIMDVQITTNGTLLNEERITDILNSGLDKIVFSVDDHHSAAYGKRNTDPCYFSTKYAISHLLRQKKKLGKSKPVVHVQANISDVDIESVKRIQLYLQKEFLEPDKIIINRLHDYRNEVDSFRDIDKDYQMPPCSYLVQRLAVFWNGEVTTCCMDYNNIFKLGNAKQKTIKEIWQSETMETLREKHFEGQYGDVPVCKHCYVSSGLYKDVGNGIVDRNFS